MAGVVHLGWLAHCWQEGVTRNPMRPGNKDLVVLSREEIVARGEVAGLLLRPRLAKSFQNSPGFSRKV